MYHPTLLEQRRAGMVSWLPHDTDFVCDTHKVIIMHVENLYKHCLCYLAGKVWKPRHSWRGVRCGRIPGTLLLVSHRGILRAEGRFLPFQGYPSVRNRSLQKLRFIFAVVFLLPVSSQETDCRISGRYNSQAEKRRRSSMKQKHWKKRIAAFLMVGCVLLGMPQRVMAEEAQIPAGWTQMPAELKDKYFGDTGYIYYDVGPSVRDGMYELKSDSRSLKAGNTVEVQIFFNPDKAVSPLLMASISLYYDVDVLQYIDATMDNEYMTRYAGSVDPGESDNSIYLFIDFNKIPGFDQYGCITTVRFKVKQDTSSTVFYCGEIDSAGDGWGYNSIVDSLDDGYYKVMSLTLEDASSTPDTPIDPAAPSVFALADASAQGSGDITVPIDIKANGGFNLLGLTIDYDAALFIYDGLEIDDSLKSKIQLDSIYPTEGQIKASYIALEDVADVGDFLKLRLKAREDAAAGTVSDVKISVSQVGNKAETAMTGMGAVCTVTLEENGGEEPEVLMPGDVNGDRSIDLVDAVYILQNFNQVREFSDAQNTAADVNKSGNVDLVDALVIMKYFNGEIQEL